MPIEVAMLVQGKMFLRIILRIIDKSSELL